MQNKPVVLLWRVEIVSQLSADYHVVHQPLLKKKSVVSNLCMVIGHDPIFDEIFRGPTPNSVRRLLPRLAPAPACFGFVALYC